MSRNKILIHTGSTLLSDTMRVRLAKELSKNMYCS
jgi:hypothetical protein